MTVCWGIYLVMQGCSFCCYACERLLSIMVSREGQRLEAGVQSCCSVEEIIQAGVVLLQVISECLFHLSYYLLLLSSSDASKFFLSFAFTGEIIEVWAACLHTCWWSQVWPSAISLTVSSTSQKSLSFRVLTSSPLLRSLDMSAAEMAGCCSSKLSSMSWELFQRVDTSWMSLWIGKASCCCLSCRISAALTEHFPRQLLLPLDLHMPVLFQLNLGIQRWHARVGDMISGRYLIPGL